MKKFEGKVAVVTGAGSRGMGTAIEFASALIAVIQDQEVADKIKESILYSSDAPQIL